MAEIINTINVEGEDYDVMPRLHQYGGLEIVEACDGESQTFLKRLAVRVDEYGGLTLGCDNSLGIQLSKESIVKGNHVRGNPLCLDDYYGNGTLTLKVGSGLSVDCDGTLYATAPSCDGSSSGSSGYLGACSNIGSHVEIDCNVSIGYGVKIDSCTEIGFGVHVLDSAYIGGEASIGRQSTIGEAVFITSGVRIDISCDDSLVLKRSCNGVFITNGALHIGDLDNNYLSIEYQGQKVKIKCEPQ